MLEFDPSNEELEAADEAEVAAYIDEGVWSLEDYLGRVARRKAKMPRDPEQG